MNPPLQPSSMQPPGIQWYPGHIAKYERQLSELLKLVDVVVEVLDARLPKSSVNARLEHKIRNKPTLIILNKSDLADPSQNKLWQKHLTTDLQRAMLYDAKSAQGKNQLVQHVLALGEPTMQRMEAKGRKRRPLRVLVAGMPNVGKSTLINSIVGRKKTKTGHRAGVTRTTQWVRIHPEIELMDTPGVIPPQLDALEAGALLATVSSIGDAAFDEEEIARFLIETVEPLYPGLLRKYFKLPEASDSLSIESMAQVRHCILPGGQPDTLRMAQAVLTEFRHAKIGRITLEHAPRLKPNTVDLSPEALTPNPEVKIQEAALKAEVGTTLEEVPNEVTNEETEQAF